MLWEKTKRLYTILQVFSIIGYRPDVEDLGPADVQAAPVIQAAHGGGTAGLQSDRSPGCRARQYCPGGNIHFIVSLASF